MIFKVNMYKTWQWDLLTSSERHIYLTLCSYANEKAECYPSNSTLAKVSALSKRTVVYAVNNLVEWKMLHRSEQYYSDKSGNSSNLYTLTTYDSILKHLPDELVESNICEILFFYYKDEVSPEIKRKVLEYMNQPKYFQKRIDLVSRFLDLPNTMKPTITNRFTPSLLASEKLNPVIEHITESDAMVA